MKVTICASIRFIKEIRKARRILEKQGHEALIPLSAERKEDKQFWNRLRRSSLKDFTLLKGKIMRMHFDKIRLADAILVLNYDKDGGQNYIGPNTFLEVGMAFDSRKKIFILNPLMEEDPNYEELVSMSPIILNGDFSKIK